MNIDRLRNIYPSGKAGKSSSSSKTKSADNQADSSTTSSDTTTDAASLSLSGSTFDNEVAFAQKVLDNARQTSLRSLKQIKQKINSGAYNDKDVHKKISSLVQQDLSGSYRVFTPPQNSKMGSAPITSSHKNQLLQNPQVTKKVADELANDIKKL